MKFTVELETAAAADTNVSVELNPAGAAADSSYSVKTVVTVKKGAKKEEGSFIVPTDGTFNIVATAPTGVNLKGVSANTDTESNAVVIDPDQKANGLWQQGKADLNVDPDVDGTVYFDWTGSAVDLKVEKLTGYDLNEIDPSGYQVAWYKDNDGAGTADKDFTKADAKLDFAPKDAGKYLFTIWPAGDLDKGTFAPVSDPIVIPVEIVKAGVESYSFYQVNALNGSDVSDTTFTYNETDYLADAGSDGVYDKVGLSVDGKATKLYKAGASVTAKGDYYYVGSAASAAYGADYAKDAGKHTLNLYKQSVATDGSTTLDAGTLVGSIDLVVSPFDISKAAVTVKDMKTRTTGDVFAADAVEFTYDGETITAGAFGQKGKNDALGLSVKTVSYEAAKGANAPYGYGGLFEYAGTYEVSFDTMDVFEKFTLEGKTPTGNAGDYQSLEKDPATGAWAMVNDNIVMSGDAPTATVRVGGSLLSGFTYGGTPFATYTKGSPLPINLTEGQSFDAKKIELSTAGAYTGKNANIKYYTAAGEEVSSIDATGLYKVVVSVNPDRAFSQVGSESFWVNVTNGTATNVIVTVGGKVCTTADEGSGSASVAYTGSPIDWSVLVKDAVAGKVLAAGTDYKVELRDADANVVVDSIVNPGNYTITVTGAAYNVTTTTVNVSVLPAAFEGAVVEQQAFGYDQTEYERPYGYTTGTGASATTSKELTVAQATGIAYTGEAVTPVIKAYVTKVVDGKTVKAYTELDPSMYTVEYTDKATGEVVKAADLKAAGSYTATLTLTDEFAAKFGKGATISGIAGGISFNIVDTVKGGFSDVKASAWYADEATKTLQLGYMKGLSGTTMLLPEASITRADVAMVLMRMAGGDPDMGVLESHPTKFADVDSFAYYAKAIDWAYKAGIVTGYDGTDSFGPNDLVTREQLATMLGRFAEKVQGEDVSAGAIEGYADADAVSDFAVEGMSWCVENGVFGVNTTALDPQGDATRAQVAAIAVRVCPAVEKDA